MDLTNLKPVPTITGLNPEIEKKAEQYAKQTWNMDMLPVLNTVFPVEMQDDEFVAELQETLFMHKYNAIEKATEKQEHAKASGRRW